MKQTAVEWLIEQLTEIHPKAFEQAKAMEKEQMILIYKAAFQDGFNGELFEFEKYYNETFKSENIVMFMTPENGEIESIILTDNPDCGIKGITFKSE